MLYKYNQTNKNLEELGFCDITDLDGKEKDLQDLYQKMYPSDTWCTSLLLSTGMTLMKNSLDPLLLPLETWQQTLAGYALTV